MIVNNKINIILNLFSFFLFSPHLLCLNPINKNLKHFHQKLAPYLKLIFINFEQLSYHLGSLEQTILVIGP